MAFAQCKEKRAAAVTLRVSEFLQMFISLYILQYIFIYLDIFHMKLIVSKWGGAGGAPDPLVYQFHLTKTLKYIQKHKKYANTNKNI